MTFLFFQEELTSPLLMTYRDLSRYFYPIRLFTVKSLVLGTIPLWNPYIFSGFPHLASLQPGVFYPLSIIYYLMPFDAAFNWFLIFHVFLGGFFIYLLARSWSMRPPAAIISGLTLIFSGFTVMVINLTTTLTSMIWIPLAFLFLDRTLKGDLRYVVALGLTLCAMFLGGEPSILYFTALVMACYAIWSWFKEDGASAGILIKKMSTFASSFAIFVCLSAFQLLPFLELVARSDRPFVSQEALFAWSLPLRDVLNFIFPYFFGLNFSRETYFTCQVWVPIIYIGFFTPFLVAAALSLKRTWRAAFFASVAAAFLLLAFGNNTPFYKIAFKAIPGMGLVRFPVRFLFMTNFCLAVLAGMGYDAYLKGLDTRPRAFSVFFKFVLAVSFIFSILLLIFYLYPNELMLTAKDLLTGRLGEKEALNALSNVKMNMTNLTRFLSFFLAAACLLFTATKLNINRTILNLAMISFLLLDFFTATTGLQFTCGREKFHKAGPNVEFLKKKEGLFRFYQSPKTEKASMLLDCAKSYEDGLCQTRDRLVSNSMMEYGLYDAGGYESINLMDYRKVEHVIETSGSPAATRMLDMLNVKYVVSMEEIKAEGYSLVNKTDSARIYENKNVLPRAFLVPEFIVLKEERDIAAKMRSMDFEPAREVILEEEPERTENREQRTENREQRKEKAVITKYFPNEVIIETVSDTPKFLLLADQYYPGWKAYLDGKKTKIYKADFVLRAVYVDTPGRHTIRFVYDPLSFKLGLTISAAALTAIIAALLISYRKK